MYYRIVEARQKDGNHVDLVIVSQSKLLVFTKRSTVFGRQMPGRSHIAGWALFLLRLPLPLCSTAVSLYWIVFRPLPKFDITNFPLPPPLPPSPYSPAQLAALSQYSPSTTYKYTMRRNLSVVRQYCQVGYFITANGYLRLLWGIIFFHEDTSIANFYGLRLFFFYLGLLAVGLGGLLYLATLT